MQGSELKAIRTELAMTQAEMAVAMGITRPHYNQVETGAAPIDWRSELVAQTLFEETQRANEYRAQIETIEQGQFYGTVTENGRERDFFPEHLRWLKQHLASIEAFIAKIKAGAA